MDPATQSALKSGLPALLAGFRALRFEFARRQREERASLADIDDVLDEGLAVLAAESDSLHEAAKVGLKGLISRPSLFRKGAPRHWIATALAQSNLRQVARAAVQGAEADPYIQAALAHYRLIADEEADESSPDAEQVFATALDFLLRTLNRELTVGDRLLLNAVHGVRDQIERLLPPDTGDLADARLRERIDHLRRSRFFQSADRQRASERLADDVLAGQLRAATAELRVEALAWCARIASFTEPQAAEKWLEEAERLGESKNEALLVAKAFVHAHVDWQSALSLLRPEASSLQATAALQILRHGLATEEALDRAKRAGIGFDCLDGDGRFSLITALIELDRWDDALAVTSELAAGDFEATPALLWVSATLLVATGLPPDFRRNVLHDIPTNPSGFPLSEDSRALDQRRFASDLMGKVAHQCEGMGLPREAVAAKRYALWLDLRDPERTDQARDTLRERLEAAGNDLAYVPLALTFGLDIDREQVEDAIERRLALAPSPTPETIVAMTTLLIDYAVHASPRSVPFFERHRALFEEYLDAGSLLGLQVRILGQSGLKDEARLRLSQHTGESLAPADRAILESALASDNVEPALEVLEAAYEADPESTSKLINLVRRLGDVAASPRYIDLARKLLAMMPTATFAEEIIDRLVDAQKDHEASALLDLIDQDLIRRDDKLLTHAAWLNFRLGQFAQAELHLHELETRRDNTNTRSLRYHLLLASGQWEALDAFLDRQWQNRSNRTPLELAQCGALAAQIGAKRVSDFLEAAVQAAPEDPQVLVAAYGAATSAGIEDKIPGAQEWILRAAEHSGEDGPVQSRSIQELIAEKPDWDARVEEASQALAAGTAPLDTIAAAVRRPWLELHLVPIIANPQEPDVRYHRLRVPFSGRMRPERLELPNIKRVALDKLAFMTLAAIDALDVLKDFDEVVLAHDTISDLFEQRSRLSFHQPSKIAFAHRLTELLARGAIEAISPAVLPDHDLTGEIGFSLATLLSGAVQEKEGQGLLVHAFPITKVGSFLSDPVDLTVYKDQLCSCAAVVDALERMGRVTQVEAKVARAYLDRQERRWPNEPEVEPGATLYLSDLAVAYFRYIGLFDRLSGAGFKVIVSRSELELAHALRDSEAISTRVDEILSRARRAVADGLEAKNFRFDVAPPSEPAADVSVEVLSSLVGQVPTLVSDDRFLNRYTTFEHEAGRCRIISSVELLQLLVDEGRLSAERLAEIKTELRRSGAAFVPLTGPELISEIGRAGFAGGSTADNSSEREPQILETGDLRAIRENMRLIQARGWFDPQSDNAWLIATQSALVDAIVAQWNAGISDDLARARSNWLVALLDLRDWGDSIVHPELQGLGAHGVVLDVAKLASAYPQIHGDSALRFANWLEEEFVGPLWEREPAIRPIQLDHLRGLVVAIAQDTSLDNDLDPLIAARLAFETLPKFLQFAMLEDESFQDKVALSVEAEVQIGEATFHRSRFLKKVVALYSNPSKPQVVRDVQDARWNLTTDADDPTSPLLLKRGKTRLRTRGMFGLHPDATRRIAMFDQVLKSEQIRPEALEAWRETLASRPLTPVEIEAAEQAFRDLPPLVENAIISSMEENKATISLLVPESRDYWEHLVGQSDALTLTDYLVETPSIHGWCANDPLLRARWALLLASHPGVLKGLEFNLSSEQWQQLGDWVLQADLLTKVGFIELSLPRAKEDPDLEKLILGLVAEVEALDPADEAGPLSLFSSIAIMVIGELMRNAAIADWPVWRRRQAALAHAALIARLLTGEDDTGRFSRFCVEQRGWSYLVQSLCDVQREPRWHPEFLGAQQLRNELIGRIVNAASGLDETLRTEGITRAIVGESGSLLERMAFPMVFWPGPLEGGLDVDLQVAPEVLSSALADALASDHLTLEAVTLLININATYILPSELLERAILKIQQSGVRLLGSKPADQASGYLAGLSMVAANSRSLDLAQLVRFLAGQLRRDALQSPSHEMQLALFAAAANGDLQGWRDFVGAWLIELAATVQSKEAAEELLSWADALCELEPLLRNRTGRARAILRLVLQQ